MSRKNLLNEGVPEIQISVTGNTVIDALFWVLNRIESDAFRRVSLSKFLEERLPFSWQQDQFVLITGHRRENFGDGFLNICKALGNIASNHDVEIVFPVHLNPNVQEPVMRLLSTYSNIHLIEPLDYPSFVWMMNQSYLIITDSGGVQEEAPSLGKPVLVMRDTTERPEALAEGTVCLVGTDAAIIYQKATDLLVHEESYQRMAKSHNPYGDGKANERILEFLKQNFQSQQ